MFVICSNPIFCDAIDLSFQIDEISRRIRISVSATVYQKAMKQYLIASVGKGTRSKIEVLRMKKRLGSPLDASRADRSLTIVLTSSSRACTANHS